MKIFVASDIHDDVEALRVFADYAGAKEADRILVLGDFSLRPYTVEDLWELSERRDQKKDFIRKKDQHCGQVLREMKGVLDSTGIPYQVIPGNYDGNRLLEEVFGDRNVHKRNFDLGEAKAFGYGGADANPQHIIFLERMGETTHFDHQELFNLLMFNQPDVCMIHNPPLNLCDDMFNGQNVGTPATTEYIRRSQPKLVLSGHIHEAGPYGNNPKGVRGISGVEINGRRTIVVNPGNLGRFELMKFPSLETMMAFDHGTFVEMNIEADGTPRDVKQYSLQERRGSVGEVRTLEEYNL